MSQGPQIEVPYPPTNGGQQRLGTLVAFVRPSVTFIHIFLEYFFLEYLFLEYFFKKELVSYLVALTPF